MSINKDKIIDSLKLNMFGAKGWMSNKKIDCPYCGREGKFGFIFKNNSGVVHCFFCGESKNIKSYLYDIDRKDLLEFEREVSIRNNLKNLSDLRQNKEEKELSEVKMPKGCKLALNDEYLNNRGFLDYHYKLYEPSYTNHILEGKLKGYLIFKIKQKGKLVSWMGRTKKDYNWHKQNLLNSKEGKEDLVLRYRNSTNTDFDSILGGFDEIKEETSTLILVEGLFDKINVDRRLSLDKVDDVKCCFTFGNSVSDGQMRLIRETKVSTIILMYDVDAFKQSQNYGVVCSQYFKTFIAEIKGDYDPGDMTEKQMNNTLNNLTTAIDFYTKLPPIKL